MQLWFVPAFSCGVHERQRFGEYCQSCTWMSHGSMCFGEQCQKIGPIDLYSHSTQGTQALGELLDPSLCLFLVCQCPAVQESTECHPLRKSLVRGKADEGFGTFLSQAHIAAE